MPVGKGKKRGSAKKITKAKLKVGIEKRSGASDMEGVLIEELINGNGYSNMQRLFAHVGMYNSTEAMRLLSQRHGLSVGREIYRRAGSSDIFPLLKVLENAGLGSILYTPVRDTVIIKCTAREPQITKGKIPLHSFEAGMISGYLSAHNSNAINTRETHCIYAGDSFCQFVSEGDYMRMGKALLSVNDAIETIEKGMKRSTKPLEGDSLNYLILAMLPVLREPAAEEASRLFFLAGKRLGADEMEEDPKESMRKIANFFGIEKIDFAKAKGGLSASIKYNDYNSIGGFLEISTKAFIGFLSKRFKSRVRIKEEALRHNYIVNLKTV